MVPILLRGSSRALPWGEEVDPFVQRAVTDYETIDSVVREDNEKNVNCLHIFALCWHTCSNST